MADDPRERIETRFWSKINKDGPVPPHCPELGPCWTWTDVPDRRGYGKLRVGDHKEFAHRLSWRLHNGPIPTNKPCVLHKCDTPLCVNPEHLFLGTQADNAADRSAKGRSATGERNGKHTHPENRARGERNGSAKLTSETAAVARRSAEEGESCKSIARRLGVSDTAIRFLIKGTTWTHVGLAAKLEELTDE